MNTLVLKKKFELAPRQEGTPQKCGACRRSIKNPAY